MANLVGWRLAELLTVPSTERLMHESWLRGALDRQSWSNAGANDVSLAVKNRGYAATDSFKITLIDVAKLTMVVASSEFFVHEISLLSVASPKLRNTLALGGTSPVCGSFLLIRCALRICYPKLIVR